MTTARLRALLADSPSLPLLLAAVGVLLWLAASDAGFEPTTAYPASLAVLALLVVGALALPPPRPSRAARAAVPLLLAYGLWCGLSILWADQQGVAWDAANRVLLYTLLLALFAAWPVSGRAALVVLGAFALGAAGIALVVLLKADAESRPGDYFLIARFIEPLGYANANACFFFMATLPSVFLASRRELPAPLRGVFLGGAGLSMGMVLLGQSRGWLFAVVPSVIIFVLLVPGRARLLLALALLGAGTAAMSGPALDVYDSFTPGRSLAGPLDEAVARILLVAGGLALAGALVALADRRVDPGSHAARRTGRVVVAATAALLVAAAVAGVVRAGDPIDQARDAWDEFKAGERQDAFAGESRLTDSLSTSRYDQWRVAWENFESAPVIGVGADNYQQDYLERGETGIKPRYPHSVELMALSETGLIGALLLFGALGTALAAVGGAAWRGRREPTLAAACAGAAAAACVYWLLHASTDWLFELPALGGSAMALLGLALAALAGERVAAEPATAAARRSPRAARALAGALAVLIALSFLAPWLSARDVKLAASGWRADPDGAFDRLDRAAAVNPLSAIPDLTAGSIAVALDRLDEAESHFRAARSRDPRDSYALLELGAIASERGRRREAVALLADAYAREPRDEIVKEALQRARRGRRLDVSQLNDQIRKATQSRIAPG